MRPQKGETVWPTVEQLEQMGLVRCQSGEPCTTYVDPVNVPSRRCKQHQRSGRIDQQVRWRDR